MKLEIRNNALHVSGYVNAVEHDIRLMINHKRNIGSTADGTLTLTEDNIGLRAQAVFTDSPKFHSDY